MHGQDFPWIEGCYESPMMPCGSSVPIHTGTREKVQPTMLFVYYTRKKTGAFLCLDQREVLTCIIKKRNETQNRSFADPPYKKVIFTD